MNIPVNDITESPKEVEFSKKIEEINRIYGGDKRREFRFPAPVEVSLLYYRSERELFFQGCLGTKVEGVCSRCLKGYSFPMEKKFDFILTPDPLPAKNGKLNRDEMGLSYYSGDEINLSPFIQEQVLLDLPIRSLCYEGCRGLCPGCGVNLNAEACGCPPALGDPRMAFFRNLRVDR